MNIFHRLFKVRTVPETDAEIGSTGEALAERFLKRMHYAIVERNWRTRSGEIDLICRDDETLVFVEVKAGRRLGSMPPEIRVNDRKRRKLTLLVNQYLKMNHLQQQARIDVISVWWEDGKPQIQHIQNAFQSK